MDANKLDRCLRLYDLLWERGSVSTREAAAHLDVDRQTAVRDVRSLRGVLVDLVEEGSGAARRYRFSRPLAPSRIRVTFADGLALHLGRELLGFLGGTTVAGWLEELEEKLAPAFMPGESDRLKDLDQRFAYLTEPYRPYKAHEEVVDTLMTAVVKARQVRLDYRDRAGWGPLNPLTLVLYRRALYVLVIDAATGDQRRLAVDRIGSATLLPERFTRPRDFDVRAELAKGFGIFADGAPTRVVMDFAPEVADLIRSRVWHATERKEDLPGGGIRLVFRAGGKELVRFALEWGDKVVVREPAALREAVVKELRGALGGYEK